MKSQMLNKSGFHVIQWVLYCIFFCRTDMSFAVSEISCCQFQDKGTNLHLKCVVLELTKPTLCVNQYFVLYFRDWNLRLERSIHETLSGWHSSKQTAEGRTQPDRFTQKWNGREAVLLLDRKHVQLHLQFHVEDFFNCITITI